MRNHAWDTEISYESEQKEQYFFYGLLSPPTKFTTVRSSPLKNRSRNPFSREKLSCPR